MRFFCGSNEIGNSQSGYHRIITQQKPRYHSSQSGVTPPGALRPPDRETGGHYIARPVNVKCTFSENG